MLICFKEKYDDRFIEGSDKENICSKVLKERIDDTMGYGPSVWYDEDTENAQRALDSGKAYEYLKSRQDYEYEGFYIVAV